MKKDVMKKNNCAAIPGINRSYAMIRIKAGLAFLYKYLCIYFPIWFLFIHLLFFFFFVRTFILYEILSSSVVTIVGNYNNNNIKYYYYFIGITF